MTELKEGTGMDTRIRFDLFLKKCKTTPGSATLKLSKLMKKKYVPLIEDLFAKGNLHPHVAGNIFGILNMTNLKISDKVIGTILDGIADSDERYLSFFHGVSFYLIHFKKRKFCPELKRILQTYGTKELLVDRTESVLYPTIEAAKVLLCKSCLPEIRKISSYGTKMNGLVLAAAREAVERLEKS